MAVTTLEAGKCTAPPHIDFVDTRSDQLVYSLDEPRITPVLARDFTFTHVGVPLEVELAVLGCSHQVTVRNEGRELVRETLACLSDREPWVPSTSSHVLARGGQLTFDSTVVKPAGFLREVDRIESQLADSYAQCSVKFPGQPGAVTALTCSASSNGLVWRTWHCYPQNGEVVETRSVLSVDAALSIDEQHVQRVPGSEHVR
ncbi:DUF2617 family protein [Brevibacterium paucivorans]|uniref:DUF2617 domain-containing protein n=1 Tax=Brevibacterium paucivorans TaxID=170994 RepID=A0A2N6VMR5_9MICO|nr:DUF2617 family protein [Brevibacterium paucivorans]PMD05387.1 DUF2617 domain-containing protein [Brevibacterium paucivorans]